MKKNIINPLKREYSYAEFVQLLPFCNEDHQQELVEDLENAKKPKWIAGKEVPENLNLVSYGMLDDLANIAKQKGIDPMVEAISRIMDLDKSKINEANVFDVIGLGKWIGKEIERINKLFSSISPHYTNEEIAAGVKSLNFGSFGVLDWYSHRQGITDQEQVRNVAWIRIYTCMYNDNVKNEYEKRLNKQYQNKYKSKHGRKS